MKSIWIGFDPREQDAFHVCVASIRERLSIAAEIYALDVQRMIAAELYMRPTERRGAQLWDTISDAPMATEFAISRFFVPRLSGVGTALFMDCDMLVRCDLAELFALADSRYAVQVVQHDQPAGDRVKMDGQIQTAYERKNWSSVMLWNVDHPANKQLTVTKLNSWSGRALHQFKWLEDSEIGALDPAWNHLVSVDEPDPETKIAHFTLGVPSMPGYEDCEFADEWRAQLALLP